MGSQGRSEVSLAVEAGAETPVVVQDAKVLTVGHKGRGQPFVRWGSGESGSLPDRAAQAAAKRATMSRCAQPERARCPLAIAVG
jgi:hypothetical protein